MNIKKNKIFKINSFEISLQTNFNAFLRKHILFSIVILLMS